MTSFDTLIRLDTLTVSSSAGEDALFLAVDLQFPKPRVRRSNRPRGTTKLNLTRRDVVKQL
jgi:hypothetical protein